MEKLKTIIKRILEWSTSKKSMYISVLTVLVYTTVCLYLLSLKIELNDTLTDKVITFCTWFAGFGGTISTVKLVKKPKNEELEGE